MNPNNFQNCNGPDFLPHTGDNEAVTHFNPEPRHLFVGAFAVVVVAGAAMALSEVVKSVFQGNKK